MSVSVAPSLTLVGEEERSFDFLRYTFVALMMEVFSSFGGLSSSCCLSPSYKLLFVIVVHNEDDGLIPYEQL